MPEKEKHNPILAASEDAKTAVISWSTNLEHLMGAATEVGIVSTDLEGNIVFFNSGAENMFGYPMTELMGKPYPLYAHEKKEILGYLQEMEQEYGGKGLTPWIRKIELLGVDRKEWTYIRKDGSRMIGSLTLTLVKNSKEETVGVLGIVVDITRQKKAEKDLQKLNEELEKKIWERTHSLQELIRETRNFAYIISHDLRVPLVNIRGFTGELKLSLQELKGVLESEKQNMSPEGFERLEQILGEDMNESFEFIENSAIKMAQMINAILRLSRMGRRNLEAVTVDTSQLVNEVLKQFAHTLESQNIEVSVRKLPKVQADLFSLEQIFGNLLQNAIIYTHPKRKNRIEIWGEKNSTQTYFYTKDRGIGIEERDLEKVFDLFSRSGKPTHGGEGMGLAYVRALVQKHGGKVWCESTLGEGSMFGFSIPNTLPETWMEENP